MKKLTATIIASILILTAPGTGCYSALAQISNRGKAPAGVHLPPSGLGAALAPITGLSDLSLPREIPRASIFPEASFLAPAPLEMVAPAVSQERPAAALEARLPALSAPVAEASGKIASEAADSFKALLSPKQQISIPAAEIGRMSPSGAHQAGVGMMDRILGTVSSIGRGAVGLGDFVPGKVSGLTRGFSPADAGRGDDIPPVAFGNQDGAGGSPDRGPSGKAAKTLASLGRIFISAGAVIGAQALAVAFLPAVFGMVPVAAAWAVGSGVILLPAAAYARYRLGLRDSPRLLGPKRVLDVFIGVYLGGVAVLIPSVLNGSLLIGLSTLPLAGGAVLAAVSAAAMEFGRRKGDAGGIIDALLGWAALNILPIFIGAASASPLTLGAVVGMLALPAMTTIAFFLGRIIQAAETGTPFSIPGSVQQIRFPSYTWVMTGVVFALLTGYTQVWTNPVFFLWMTMGSTRLFNLLFIGAALAAAATGFSAPITFLVLAFAPERVAMWTEGLLGRMLKAGPPAPSTKAEPVKLDLDSEPRWPQFHYWLKTGSLLASLATLGLVMGATVFGFTSLATNFAIGGAMALIPFLLSKKLIKVVMKATPMKEEEDPVVFSIMRELREIINSGRAQEGKKPIPMPEMVNANMGVPNAFATGTGPMNAMVGVTPEIKRMTLDPNTLRGGLLRLLDAADPSEKSFHVFRTAIRGSIAGIGEGAGPYEIIAALRTADEAQLRHLGRRVLRGVMGHEFSHVMHRDMLLGTVAGSMSSAIAFSSYGVLWAVGHAQSIAGVLWGKLTGASRKEKPAARADQGAKSARGADGTEAASAVKDVRPEVVEPVSAAAALKSALALLKIFAALWGPVMATILQMGSSRTREGHADEAGAQLTGDPEALALGLGLLTTWRPGASARIDRKELPLLASQAHIMTVNPIDQLRQAGAIPGQDFVTRLVVGKEDDFFFNLFITHPNTRQRIERLHEMALANKPRTVSPRHGRGSGPGQALAHRGGLAPQGFDPNSFKSFTEPGIDDRLLAVVSRLKEGIESDPRKSQQLGHLLGMLKDFSSQGGSIRYAYPKQNDQEGKLVDAPSSFEPSINAIYINTRYINADATLVAALLAARLQEAYDHASGRATDTAQSSVRTIRAMDAFLDGLDMEALAKGLNINNVWEVSLFEGLIDERIHVALGFSNLVGLYSPGSMASNKYAVEKSTLQQERSVVRRLVDRLELLKKTSPQGGQDSKDLAGRMRVLGAQVGKFEGSILMREAWIKKYELDKDHEDRRNDPLDTPLSVVAESNKSRLNLKNLKWVQMEKEVPVDPKMAEVLGFIRETIAASSQDSPVRQLQFLMDGLEKLLQSGGRLYVDFQNSGVLAYFSTLR